MARSRKKKWKSRIKKALKLAAIGGAGYLAAKRFGGNRQGTASSNPVGGVDQIAADAAAKAPVTDVVNPNLNKVVSDSPIRNEGRTRLSVDGVTPGMVLNARRKVPGYGSAVAPPGILNPYNPRTHRIRGMKKGGRVTGIAKRGFGRALMKGKK